MACRAQPHHILPLPTGPPEPVPGATGEHDERGVPGFWLSRLPGLRGVELSLGLAWVTIFIPFASTAGHVECIHNLSNTGVSC